MKDHAQWADDYRALCRWAMRMARDARERGNHAIANRWNGEANKLIDKLVEHRNIVAQEASKKDR